jgi:hypothetical protein
VCGIRRRYPAPKTRRRSTWRDRVRRIAGTRPDTGRRSARRDGMRGMPRTRPDSHRRRRRVVDRRRRHRHAWTRPYDRRRTARCNRVRRMPRRRPHSGREVNRRGRDCSSVPADGEHNRDEHLRHRLTLFQLRVVTEPRPERLSLCGLGCHGSLPTFTPPFLDHCWDGSSDGMGGGTRKRSASRRARARFPGRRRGLTRCLACPYATWS